MANTDSPRGFYAISADAKINKYSPQRGYLMTASATVYEGDVVKIVAAGTCEAAAADIGLAAIGIAAEHKVAAATGKYYLKVYDDPDTVFGVQADGDTVLTQAAVGNTANHVAGSGSDTTKLSGHELDASDVGTGAQFTIEGLVDTSDNSWLANAEVLVVFNEHKHKAAVAGV